MNNNIELQILPDDFSVSQIPDIQEIPLSEDFVFLGKTNEEISLVCRTAAVPLHTIAREDSWKAIKVQGILDFSLVGILAGISAVLADRGIPIFVVSTYNTDYILMKAKSLAAARSALTENGYTFV